MSSSARSEEPAAPDLVDVETVSALRRFWLGGRLTAQRFEGAVSLLLGLPVVRFPVGPLMRRAWQLRGTSRPTTPPTWHWPKDWGAC